MCKELIPDLQAHTVHLDSLAQQMRTLIAINQRLADLLDAAIGLPEGDPYIIDVASPTTSTVYNGAVVAQASILRQLSLSQHGAAGIVTVYLKSPYAIADSRAPGTPTGARILWRGAIGQDTPASFGFRVRIPAGATISITTAAAAATNLNLCAVIDQVESTAIDQFYGRR